MGQDQPKVIVCIVLVVLAYTMPYIKFQGHRFIGSGEEDFFIVNGHDGHVGHVTRTV